MIAALVAKSSVVSQLDPEKPGEEPEQFYLPEAMYILRAMVRLVELLFLFVEGTEPPSEGEIQTVLFEGNILATDDTEPTAGEAADTPACLPHGPRTPQKLANLLLVYHSLPDPPEKPGYFKFEMGGERKHLRMFEDPEKWEFCFLGNYGAERKQTEVKSGPGHKGPKHIFACMDTFKPEGRQLFRLGRQRFLENYPREGEEYRKIESDWKALVSSLGRKV
ncbi:hypothetical protein F5Y17DRAFT_363519 [Xylariaceae sp. FL0594]|nr:hypothetical protein F5Y17DRAFT_363519 [Xylariaceae sp. FL0594]